MTHKKEKKVKPSRLRQMNPFFHYNPGTLRAIQMIETAKLRTDRNSDFKTRLFAKFATNNRLTKLVDERPPTKMVSFSVQTSPIVEREKKSNRMSYGVGLGSVDSFSSINQTTGNDTSTIKSYDIDSLCSSAYYDVNFNGYNTESIQQMIAQATPPIIHKKSKIQTPPGAPLIMLERTSHSPPNPLAGLVSQQQKRRSSAANCLPIPTNSADKVHELPLLNSRMPLARCPSCSTVSTDTMPEEKTVQRVHDMVGIMPSDFLQHNVGVLDPLKTVYFQIHKSSGSRPTSSMSEYETSQTIDHSFHRHTAPSPPSNRLEHISHIPIRHHQLHRSKRLDDSKISSDAETTHDKSPMLDSGLGELAKTKHDESPNT